MSDPKLLPCPCCGYRARVVETHRPAEMGSRDKCWHVQCINVACGLRTANKVQYYNGTPDECKSAVVELWNRRV